MKTLFIAEIGHNANGSMRVNKLLIDEAKRCGADIAKFQAYDIDTILKPWSPHYMELKMTELTKDELIELSDYCKQVDIEFMASAFDPLRVLWLDNMGVKRHKLASRSICEGGTIRAMEETGKPIIASLGWWPEVANGLVPIIQNAQFLYCVSEYPAVISEKDFPKEFNDKLAGFSDHTIGIDWAKEAIRRGATIIEKHFTLDKKLPGCDQAGSADPSELSELITWARQYERLQG